MKAPTTTTARAAHPQPDQKSDKEPFLQLIVCAGAGDRFKAMSIRKTEGIEAAREFIEHCTITQETADDATAYEVSILLSEATAPRTLSRALGLTNWTKLLSAWGLMRSARSC